jgi:hypothetical protein
VHTCKKGAQRASFNDGFTCRNETLSKGDHVGQKGANRDEAFIGCTENSGM